MYEGISIEEIINTLKHTQKLKSHEQIKQYIFGSTIYPLHIS